MSNPVLEEKLCLLENWLEEDPDDVALAQKHEEYEGLLEEVEILGKKMRKTIKLLSKNDPSKEKLERKKDQYEREFQDIVLYVQNDPFFQNQEELPPSSLLGKPLEMVMEMPGLEESIASMDFNNSQNDLRGGNLEEIRQSVHTLQKKLKKVEAMLETASFKEAKKLQKKRDQYIEEIRQEQSKLARIQEKLDNSRSNLRDGPDERRKREDLLESQLELEDDMEDQELSQDASCDMSDVQEAAMRGKALLDKEQEDTQEEEEDELPQQSRKKKHSKEYKTLKKKLEKINSLIAGSSNPKEQKKLQKKRNDYASQLDLLGENDDGDDNGVFGDSHSSMGSKSLQLSVDTELIDDEHDELEHTELRDDSPRAGKKHTKEYKTLKKKLAKIDQMIAESECNSKEQKKLQKKRNGYVSQLESLGEGEGFGDSHSSLGSKSLQLSVDTELIDDEHDELTHPQDNFQEHTELRDDSPRAGKKHTKEYKTLKKKLAKIDQMIAESECNSKEQKKLQKKRNGYVSQLESLGEGEGFGDSHSSLGSKSLQLSVDTELIDDEHDELTHPQDNFQEHTELRDDSPRAGKKHTKEYKTLKKKMAKIDQMIAESEWNSMEQKKLQKKRNGYVSQLESLGEGEGEGEGFGDSHSSMGSASISLSVEPNESEMLRIKEERLKEIRWLEAKQERLQTEMEEERRRMAKEAGFVDDNIDSERSDSDEESYDSGDEEQARLEEEDRLAEICRLEEQQRILLEEEAERQAEICRLEEGNRQKKKEEDAKTRSAPTEKHNRDDKLLRKKLKKAQQMIEETAASKGTESKEYKKLYKKAAEYASELGETLSENNFYIDRKRADEESKEGDREAQQHQLEEQRRQEAEEKEKHKAEAAEEKRERQANEEGSKAAPKAAQDFRAAAKAKLQAVERAKEYKTLKKKLDKLDEMMEDHLKDGNAEDSKFQKWEKKRKEYIGELEIYDEWKDELEIRRQAVEEKRLQKEQEAEAERLRLKEEKRLAEERKRLEREAEEQRERELAEAKEREEREAKEAQDTAEREAKEAEERVEREARDALEQAERDAREAQEGAEREVREAKEREECVVREQEERERREQEAAERRARGEPEPEEPKPSKRSSQASELFLDRRNLPTPHSGNTKKILRELEAVENTQEKYVKTLNQNGIAVSEDIPYEVAKEEIAEITEKMKALNVSGKDPRAMQKEMYKLEEEMSKYITALMLTDEYAEEQLMAEQKWDDNNREGNEEALRKLRRHMHVNIKNMTEEELTTKETPNGKLLPKPIARKFKRTNVLQLIRSNPGDLERMHPSLLEGVATTGLTLTERRALYEHLKDVGATWQSIQADPSIERKWVWFSSIKSKLKEDLNKYNKHIEEYGPPDNHPYAKRNDPNGGGCPLLGNQCPVKADKVISYDDDYGYNEEAEYEGVKTQKSSLTDDSTHSTQSASSKKKKAGSTKRKSSVDKDVELMGQIRGELMIQDPESEIDKKLLRELFFAKKRGMSLEKQLTQNGIAIPKDDISYSKAKEKIAELTEEIKVVASKMGEVSDPKELYKLEAEYGKLSEEMEKYNNAMRLTKEWAQEQLEKERQWEESVRFDNQEALKKIRRQMPVYIRDMSEEELTRIPSPNGQVLPQKIARKFKRTNILLLLRSDPSSIEPMHPSSIEAMRTTGLTLTERRALHEHLKALGPKWKALSNDKMAERKWMWQESLRSKFKELVGQYQAHIDKYGPPDNHPYAKRNDPSAGGCPLLGNQCPVKADLALDYNNDYGYPEGPEYNIDKAVKSNLLSVEDLEKRKNEEDGVNIYEEENLNQAAPPPRPVVPPPPPPPAAAQRPKPPGGLMAAISAGGDDSVKKPERAEPTAVIGSSGADAAPPKRPPPVAGGLMAAIAARGKK